MKLDAKQLRVLEEEKVRGPLKVIKRNAIYFILENIYDTYNVGGLFRLADALAIEKMYLCGTTEIPPNSRIKKASIGTYKVVPWEYRKSAEEAIADLRNTRSKPLDFRTNDDDLTSKVDNLKSLQVFAVEQSPKAKKYTEVNYSLPLVLIFGNESTGILPETLKLADQIVEIPMWGINKSLNVIVSAAIVSYWAINGISK